MVPTGTMPLPLDTFRQDRPLALSMAVATRAMHAKLNKLILDRLPLALPPLAASPLIYASGLMHMAPIFMAFEGAWSDMLDEDDHDAPGVPPGVVQMLHSLYMPGMMRTDRLEADVAAMMGWTREATRDHLESVGETGHLGEFVSHIRRVIRSKPHVLVSYSYVLFMALFAGGRFIRAALEAAGDEFWQRRPDEGPPHATPLEFFRFDTRLDGEDLKQEFKRRLAEAERELGYREKHDVVQEAICIFQNMMLVVGQLDGGAAAEASPSSSPADRRGSAGSWTTVMTNPVSKKRFRDSVALTRARSAQRWSQEMRERRGEAEHHGPESRASAALADGTVAWEPNGHPAGAFGTEEAPPSAPRLAGGASKSVRFEKALPRPSRGYPGGRDTDGGHVRLAGAPGTASRRVRRREVTGWVVGLAIGLVVLGAALSAWRGGVRGVTCRPGGCCGVYRTEALDL